MSKVNVHTEFLDINWSLIGLISDIDRFDASWAAIERREGQSLKELKSIATVRSVGASTRIEGSKLTDEEVDVLLKNVNISKVQERDEQEVVGYYETLDVIDGNFREISITENNLKNLHSLLLKYSDKDEWHRGNYKQHSNAVEANMPDGTVQIIFQTTAPGFPTEDAMDALVTWHDADIETHALVKCALFCYDFVSIHPFQDGNGRLSRLLATLLLRKYGYKWIRYVSLEHEIENQKNEYYRVLRVCQSQRPGEDITAWVIFFLTSLKNIQKSLMLKLETHGAKQNISQRELHLLTIIEANPGIKTSEMAKKLNVSSATVKRMLNSLLLAKLIERQGVGAGSYYTLL